MAYELDLKQIPIKALRKSTLQLISTLLDPEKVLPTDDNYPRDWRGLATLVSIPGQYNASLYSCKEHTERVLELWSQKDVSANVAAFQECLQRLDRYDVLEDSKDLLEADAAIYLEQQQIRCLETATKDEEPDDSLVYDDIQYGTIQKFHAYVLYADEDACFVNELIERMTEDGFKICTKNNLLPGFATQYGPVSRLISERCQKIILIYSPEFLNSSDNAFYMNYAQAVSIQNAQRKILPCMYKECELPGNFKFYHKLYYPSPDKIPVYNFWEKLSLALEFESTLPRTSRKKKTSNCDKIKEPRQNGLCQPLDHSIPVASLLPLPLSPTKYPSQNDLQKPEITKKHSSSLSNLSKVIDKKPNFLKRIFRNNKSKKKKFAVAE